MIIILITIFLTVLVTSLFGHCMHWALHQPGAGRAHQAHMVHHLKLYPPNDYVSKTYRHAGKDSSPQFFATGATPLVVLPGILWVFGIMSLTVMLTVLAVEVVMAFLNNYLHDSFHIENHRLNRVWAVRRWYERLTAVHYLHHLDMTKNFGIFTFWWDRFFGSYTNYVETSPPQEPPAP
jgi:sterol desaturase/sphingolipid hydroxylase (fatty acid hydroxylase superfamily)